MKDTTRFIVLFEGRSGSTYLVEALDSHPNIISQKELFASINERFKDERKAGDEQLRCLDSLYGCDSFDCQAVGFKTKLKDILLRDETVASLRRYKVKVILLRRKNRLKLMVSLLNAMRLNDDTGDWNLYDETKRPNGLRVDIPQFKEWLAKKDSSMRELAEFATSLELPVLNVFYEDILYRREETFQQICEWLGVNSQYMEGKCKKNTSDDLAEVIENYSEFVDAFHGTEYEAMAR